MKKMKKYDKADSDKLRLIELEPGKKNIGGFSTMK